MSMAQLLSPSRIVMRLRASAKREVLRRLAIEISPDVDLPRPVVVNAVLDAADIPSFGPGNGVALLHAMLPGLREPIALLARLDPPIGFGAADGGPTDLVMLLLSPSENVNAHLRALSCIARRLSDQAVRAAVRAAESRDAIYVSLLGTELAGDYPANRGGLGALQQKHTPQIG